MTIQFNLFDTFYAIHLHKAMGICTPQNSKSSNLAP